MKVPIYISIVFYRTMRSSLDEV